MNYRKSVLIYGRNVARKTHLLTSFVFIHLHFLQVFSIFQNHKQIKLSRSRSANLFRSLSLSLRLCRYSIIYTEDLFCVQMRKQTTTKVKNNTIVVQIGLMRTKILPVKIIYLNVFIMKSAQRGMRNGKGWKKSSISISIIWLGIHPVLV